MLHNIFVAWLSRIMTVRDNMRIADDTQHSIAFAAWRILRVLLPLHWRRGRAAGIDVVVLRLRHFRLAARGGWC
jgi:hypothetical protein